MYNERTGSTISDWMRRKRMSQLRTPAYFWIGTVLIGATCACGLVSPGTSPASTGIPASSGNTGSAPTENFPLTPNPLNVQITLDTQHVISDRLGEVTAGVINQEPLSGKDANGNSLDVIFPGDFLTQNPDGSYDEAFGTAVTATPVSAIGGIPFAKGFVTAFQFGPEGLLMSAPVSVEIDVQGVYNDLVGFASNGDGTDFHLIPIDSGPLGTTGQTSVLFDIDHFSVYGVAEATAAEVISQLAHPPSSPQDQDDDLLAAPQSTKQAQLQNEQNRLLKLLQNHTNCNDVITATRNFVKWMGQVQTANLENAFKDATTSDTNTLISLLKACLVVSCPACLQTQAQAQSQNPGQNKNQVLKQKQATAKTVMILANYIETFDMLQNNSSEANYYRDLARKCAKNAGLPDPTPPVADCFGAADCGKITPTELACPAQ